MRIPLTVLATITATALTVNTAAAQSAAGVDGTEPGSVQGQRGIQLAQAGGGQSNRDAMNMLFNQISDMRRELESLRGMVEEQAFMIRRMQRENSDRYTDLDARISALYQELDSGDFQPIQPGAGGQDTADPAVPSTGDAGIDASSVPTAPDTGSAQQSGVGAGGARQPDESLPDPSDMTEQQLYQHVLDVLLQDEAYEYAIDGFSLYLDEYPDGRFVTNAHYWTGQAYVNLSEWENARQSFETILNQYPDGRKVDDAMYSLGTVYDRLGDSGQARDMLQQVMTRFPNTSAANLADLYLRSLN